MVDVYMSDQKVVNRIPATAMMKLLDLMEEEVERLKSEGIEYTEMVCISGVAILGKGLCKGHERIEILFTIGAHPTQKWYTFKFDSKAGLETVNHESVLGGSKGFVEWLIKNSENKVYTS